MVTTPYRNKSLRVDYNQHFLNSTFKKLGKVLFKIIPPSGLYTVEVWFWALAGFVKNGIPPHAVNICKHKWFFEYTYVCMTNRN